MDYLTIGEFARDSGLTAKALRLYDDLGLLEPADVDPGNGYRRYTRDQLGRARLVARLRLLGMPLARIRSLLQQSAGGAADELAAYWRQVETDVRARGEIVRALLLELRQEEIPMKKTQRVSLTAAFRHGQGARETQQDAVYAGGSAVAIADGFGNDTSAARAAAAVAALEDVAPGVDPRTVLGETVAAAARAATGAEGGTTLTALWLYDGRVHTAHVGDGRLHRLRDGHLTPLTHDHTLVAALIEEGKLTEDEARSHPHRNLLNRALTDGRGEADLAETNVQAGDRFVLTTDGVHAVVPPETLADLLRADADLDRVAADVAAAVEDAGAPDNYSVVVMGVS